jgi:hypothetical protein
MSKNILRELPGWNWLRIGSGCGLFFRQEHGADTKRLSVSYKVKKVNLSP